MGWVVKRGRAWLQFGERGASHTMSPPVGISVRGEGADEPLSLGVSIESKLSVLFGI